MGASPGVLYTPWPWLRQCVSSWWPSVQWQSSKVSSVKSLPPDAVVIVAPALDVVNVKDAPNSSPEEKLEESDLEDVDNIEVLLAAY